MTPDVLAMRQALTHTWFPFFARFPRPTDIQLQAWEPLLKGRDVLLMAATASGKTEAAVAPMLERLHGERDAKRPVLALVCPTRALVNDLYRRLEGPLSVMDLDLHRRTGDHPTLPPGGCQVLVTTPESLDSLLVRHTRFLTEIRAILLDELHILDGSPRGDQLAILVARLRSLGRGRPLQAAVTSATLHDPQGIARRYLGPDSVCARALAPPALELIWEHTPSPGALVERLASLWGREGAKKVLVFVDRRADVEKLASQTLRRTAGARARIYAHHGSLSRTERERVEKRFLDDPSAICFATMTLELGIDIGDVDLVVQVGPPSSVASFLQRLGRGNRRSGRARLLCAYRDAGERARFEHLALLAGRLELCGPPYHFNPSVLVQQTGSLLFQSPDRFITTAALRERLPAFLRERYTDLSLGHLMESLVDKEWLLRGRGRRYEAGAALHRIMQIRQLHANLPQESAGMQVVDETTGQVLGEVAEVPSESGVAIGGRQRTVSRVSDGRIYVEDRGGLGEAPRFAPRGRISLSCELARSLSQHLGLRPGSLWLVIKPGCAVLLHFEGTLRGTLLGRHLRQAYDWPVDYIGGLGLRLRKAPVGDRLPVIEAAALHEEVVSMAESLGSLASAGPHHRLLPEAWQRELALSLLPPDALAVAWSEAPMNPVEACPTEVREVLDHLC